MIRARIKFDGSKTHLVAVGANLPGPRGASPRQLCETAINALTGITGLRVEARSRWFSSAPVPASDQPRYINGVVRVRGDLDPAFLLAELHALERAAGRVRGERDAARPLDLDIIDMDGLVRDAPDPVLPHPRAHLRAFVLWPLRDVAPRWVHPRLGVTIGALIAALPPQDIHPL